MADLANQVFCQDVEVGKILLTDSRMKCDFEQYTSGRRDGSHRAF